MGTPRMVTAALLAGLAAALGLACGRALPRSPHLGAGAPAGGARPEAAHRANEGCTTCHEAIAQEWRASNHAEAFRHGTFQLAYTIEPLPFCARCHAPEADAARPLPPASDLGVACVTCHPGGRRWRIAGAATATPLERASAACASCHEFPFPSDGAGGPTRLMQKTVSEHAASSARGTACVGCHMRSVAEPGGGRHVDHRFFASRSAELVRSAARVEVRREGDAAVFTFTRASAGHALPTGDIFRRLRLVVESDAAARTAFLSRKSRESSADGQEPDTRPFADGRDVYVAVIPLHDLRGELRYRVVYERVAHPNGDDEEGATVDGAIELARGELR